VKHNHNPNHHLP